MIDQSLAVRRGFRVIKEELNMKFIHLADLHLGKQVNGYSMLEDQAYVLRQIEQICRKEAPDAVLICGDVYDRPVPSAEAVRLLDSFLTALPVLGCKVLMISGNHDSAERLSFGARLMEKSGLYLQTVYEGKTRPVLLEDDWGSVAFYLLPFFKPASVRAFFPEVGDSYTVAVRLAVEEMGVDPNQRSVLLAHQFVTGSVRSESEEIHVGGTDNVDSAAMAGFDYVALGHLHGPQQVGCETMRYAGSPLKYSFSEKDQKKSVPIVEMREKGDISIRLEPLTFLHDLREIRGTYNELTNRANYMGTEVGDYLKVVLTDEDDVPDAMSRLRSVYPNIMQLEYDNIRTRSGYQTILAEDAEDLGPLDLFANLYEKQNGQPMNEAQKTFVSGLIEHIWEGEA